MYCIMLYIIEKIKHNRSMVAKWLAQSLATTEVLGSSPGVGNNNFSGYCCPTVNNRLANKRPHALIQ